MYRHMGLLPTHLARLITTSPHQYVAGTYTLRTCDREWDVLLDTKSAYADMHGFLMICVPSAAHAIAHNPDLRQAISTDILKNKHKLYEYVHTPLASLYYPEREA